MTTNKPPYESDGSFITASSELGSMNSSMLFVVCHTDVQLNALLQNQGIKRNRVRRLREIFAAHGARSDFPLIRLDGYWLGTKRADELCNYWKSWGGTFMDVSEDVVLGKKRLLLPDV